MLLVGWGGVCGIDVEDALDEIWLWTNDNEVGTATSRPIFYVAGSASFIE
jgi:hypothetical protein